MPTLPELKARLYERARSRPDELHDALLAWGGDPGDPLDFLDGFVTEWVDAEGWTEVERAVAEGELPAACLGWSREVRTALWVVDGWEGERVLLRDVATEEELAVRAPGQEADLPRRAVVKGRVIPWEGALIFSGAPDVYHPMGVVARMELLRAWTATGEPERIARLRGLRAAYVRLREEREAFVEHFGDDVWVASGPAELEERLARFVSWLQNERPMPSLGGLTRARAWRESKGDEPAVVQLTLGPTLTGPGRPGVIYDPVEGVHFLPALGEFAAHLRGEAHHPEVFALYLNDPGITSLPFRRLGTPEQAAARLGTAAGDWETVLAPWKPPVRRPNPSVLPGFEELG